MKRRHTTFLCLAAVLAAFVAGCGGSPQRASSTQRSPAQARGIVQLRSIDQLRTAFNAHPGVPRLIVLVSPT
jgi:hypothetical protein